MSIKSLLVSIILTLSTQFLYAEKLQISCKLLFNDHPLKSSSASAKSRIQATAAKTKAKLTKKLFSSPNPIFLTIEGDFTKVKKIAKSKRFYSAPDRDAEQYTVIGQLTDTRNPNDRLNVIIRPRGNSSLGNDFPELKINLVKDQARELYNQDPDHEIDANFRLNTHISDTAKDSHNNVGYLNSEQTPIRESLAYSWAHIIGLETALSRLANITYTNTANNKSINRYGLMLETNKDLEKRMNLPELDEETFAFAEKSNIDPELGAKIHLFHKLIGNDDYGLRVHESKKAPNSNSLFRPLYNTRLFVKESGEVIPVINDFDLSTLVYGVNHFTSEFQSDPYFGLNSRLEAFFMYRFLLMRQHFSIIEIRKAISHFKSVKSILYKSVEDLYANKLINQEGYINAIEHLDIFFKNVDRALDFKIITTLNVPFFKDPSGKIGKLKENPIEQDPDDIGFLRPGTPVIELEQVGDLIKVAILDLNGYLKEGEDAIGYIPAETNLNQKSVPLKIIRAPDYRDWQL